MATMRGLRAWLSSAFSLGAQRRLLEEQVRDAARLQSELEAARAANEDSLLRIAGTQRDILARLAAIDARMREVTPLRERVDALAESAQAQARALQDELREWAAALERLSARQSDRLDEVEAMRRRDVTTLHGRIETLAPPFPALPDLDSNATAAWFHARVEAEFRGSMDDIRQRLTVYLPHVRSLRERPAHALDLGCGRGEWLELLRDEGIAATGVDENEVSVDRCTLRGLHAVRADALEYMRRQPDCAFSIVTAFHLVEHLATEAVVAMLLEARRLLRPGGLLILETPNADNIRVGATTFHLDPTHHRPVPVELLRLVVGFAGFEVIDILELHPDEAMRDVAASEHWPPTLLNLLGGPRDLGLVATPRLADPAPA